MPPARPNLRSRDIFGPGWQKLLVGDPVGTLTLPGTTKYGFSVDFRFISGSFSVHFRLIWCTNLQAGDFSHNFRFPMRITKKSAQIEVFSPGDPNGSPGALGDDFLGSSWRQP